ncbi:MAG: hypothetical protein IJS32_06685 [Kiritimatiellae bacterium]|nr:hypothetical protein [Kiritimatiellia bacterium]
MERIHEVQGFRQRQGVFKQSHRTSRRGGAFHPGQRGQKWEKRPHDRIDYPDYPERAVTEALGNAFIHRDYLVTGSEVHVDMYDDRLEITSPGGMPGNRKIEDFDIRSIPSIRRNPLLADM